MLTRLTTPTPDPAATPRAPAGELGFALVSRTAIAAINEQHLGHLGPTDVITFDYRDPADTTPTGTLGDIIVCPALAIAAAPRHRHSPAAETVLYLIHGVLHLTGHDDTTPTARRAMRRAEAKLMTTLRAEYDLESLFAAPKEAAE